MTIARILRTLSATFLAVAVCPAARADSMSRPEAGAPVPTRLVVRVLSKDAKFIGTTMGGVRITVRDADSGELLAQGTTRGGTGDTQTIMKQDWKRGAPLATPDAAAFTATIPLDAPRRVEVVATGPIGQPQAAVRASVTHWMVPGRHIDRGDALTLVMPGLALDVLDPPAHARIAGVPASVTVRANLVML
jgi:hypothetical protein